MITFKQFLTEGKDPHARVIARLEDLNNKLNRWAYKWDPINQPPRMIGWVDEYNDLKQQHKDGAWKAYCDKNNRSYSHDAYDCLA